MPKRMMSTVVFKFNFCIMWFLWLSTVLTLKNNLSAMSLLLMLFPHNFNISICRELNASIAGAGRLFGCKSPLTTPSTYFTTSTSVIDLLKYSNPPLTVLIANRNSFVSTFGANTPFAPYLIA